MENSRLGWADYVVIGLMLAVSASVGLFFRFTGGRQKTTHEFLMGGKNMAIFPVAFSLMATYMSAISVLGMPAETYMYGTQFLMWIFGSPIGALIAAYGFLPVFYEMDVSTAYEYLEKRFGQTTRTIAAGFFTLQMILYMAVVLYAPSLALNAVTGLSTWASVISLAAVCTFYCSLGGLKAVLWTDVFQAVLMYITIIAVVVKVCMVLGLEQVYTIAEEGGRLVFFNTSFDFTARYTLWNAIVSGVIFSCHTYGTNQAQIQRMLSVGNLKRAQNALFWSIPLIVVFNIFTFFDGIVIYALYHDCDPMKDPATQLNSADQVSVYPALVDARHWTGSTICFTFSLYLRDMLMPLAILRLFGDIPGLTGLCIAGVFSASLSTVSSAVNSLTAVTMEDFIRPFCFCKCLSESWMTFMAKSLAVGYGGLTLLLTFIVAHFRGVIEASNVLFGMVGGPILGIYSLGMFTKTANEQGTLCGLLVGFVVNAWLGFGSYIAKPPVPSLLQSTEGCFNATSIHNQSILDLEEDRYILPVYTLSFIWFPVIGALVVIIVGYVTSFLYSFWADVPQVEQKYLSPLVRKFYFKSDTKLNGKSFSEIEMNEKVDSTTNGHTNRVES